MFRAVLISLMVGLALAGAACGSSSSSGSSSTSTPVLTSTPSEASTSTASSGDMSGGSSYCAQGKKELDELRTKLASVGQITSQSDRLKQYMSTLKDAYSNAESGAPAAIEPDIAEIVDFINKMDAAFAAHNYNLLQSAATVQPLFLQNQAKLKQAGRHLKAWAVANCGA